MESLPANAGAARNQRTGYGKSNCAKLKQNLSSQPRLWIDRLTLAANFEIERRTALTAAAAYERDRLAGTHWYQR